MNFTLELTIEEIKAIRDSLLEQPAKVSHDLINKIDYQIGQKIKEQKGAVKNE